MFCEMSSLRAAAGAVSTSRSVLTISSSRGVRFKEAPRALHCFFEYRCCAGCPADIFCSIVARMIEERNIFRRFLGSGLLIWGENKVVRFSGGGDANEGVDQLEVGTRICELSRIEFAQQVFDGSVGARIGHRVHTDRQHSRIHVRG